MSGFTLCHFSRHLHTCNVSIIHLVTLGSYTSSLFSPKSFSLDYCECVNKASLAPLGVCRTEFFGLALGRPVLSALLGHSPLCNAWAKSLYKPFFPPFPALRASLLLFPPYLGLSTCWTFFSFLCVPPGGPEVSPAKERSIPSAWPRVQPGTVSSQLSYLLPLCTFQYWGITNQKLQIKSHVKQMLSGTITSPFCAFCFENHKHSKFWNHTDCQLSKQLRNSSSHTPLSGFSWTADRSTSETCMCP